jgi:hypothetical protein
MERKMCEVIRFVPKSKRSRPVDNLGEVLRFIPRSERERARLIRDARAIYDNIFPPVDPVIEQDEAPVGQTVSGANVHRSDWILLS